MSTVRALDVSSYQPTNLTGLIQQYQPQHVIVHLYTQIETPPWSHSAAQVQSALDNGCTVGGYCFLYPGTNMVHTINSAVNRCALIGLVLPILWLDVEEFQGQNLTAPELSFAVNQCEALGVPVGLYTSNYMWSKLGNPSGFEDLPVWAAQYNGIEDLASVSPIPNLPMIVGHQYQGLPIDLSVMLEEYTKIPQPDPCLSLKEGLREIIDRRPYRAPARKALKTLLDL